MPTLRSSYSPFVDYYVSSLTGAMKDWLMPVPPLPVLTGRGLG